MRWAVSLMVFAMACRGDVCDPYPGKSCIALEVRGTGDVDELIVGANGFSLTDVRTAKPDHSAQALPVSVAVLPGASYAGSFSLTVEGRMLMQSVGRAEGPGRIDKAGSHVRLSLSLSGGTADFAGLPMNDLSTTDAVVDAAVVDLRPGSTLDPSLSLPESSGAVCSAPGSRSECLGSQLCRLYSSVDGRCESCAPCGNLHAACTKSSECDILFQCFHGRCSAICTLGMGFECGGPSTNCVSVGNPTYGMCLN